MKISRFALVCICLIALTAPAWSQPVRPDDHAPAIPGFLNPRTGAFTPMHVATGENPETAIEAATAVTGTFKVTFSITVKSSIPTTTPIVCSVTAVTTDPLPNSVFDEANIIATRSGAGSASCTVTMPYSWRLSTPSSDFVVLGYGIAIESTTLSRESEQLIDTFKVPSSGATTPESVNATI